MSYLLRVSVFALAVLGLVLSPARAVEISDVATLPYFDVTVGFPEVKSASVYRSFDTNNEIFYLFPNDIQVSGATYRYEIVKGRIKGILSATVKLGMGSSLDRSDAIDAVRKRFANADIRPFVPSSSQFILQVWGVPQELNGTNTSILPFEGTTLQVYVEEPLSRALVRDIASAQNIFAITLRYTVKGVTVDEQAKPAVAERNFTIGRTFGISCNSTPERVVNIATGRIGCLYSDALTGEKAKRIQMYLKCLGYYTAKTDGVVGPLTKRAIETFELDTGREPEGVPSNEILSSSRESFEQRFCKEGASNVGAADPTLVLELCKLASK